MRGSALECTSRTDTLLNVLTCGLWRVCFSHTLRRADTPMTPTMHAAWLVEDAMRGVPPERRRESTPQAVRLFYLLFLDIESTYNATLVALVLLTFCEPPMWCLGTGDTATRPWRYDPPEVTCPAPDGGFIYLSQIPYVPVGWGVVVELCCYGVWLIRSALMYEFNGKRATGKGTRLWQLRLGSSVVAICDALVYLGIVFVPGTVPLFRLAPFARLVHIATVESVHKTLALISHVLRPFASIFTIYLGAWAFIAWVMCLLLEDMDDPLDRCAAQEAAAPAAAAAAAAASASAAAAAANTADANAAASPAVSPAYLAALANTTCETAVNAGFDSFSNALYSMAVASTNANVPLQSLPAYSHVRAIGGLWAFTYFSVNFVMLSLILAVVYNAYSAALKDHVLASFRNRALGLRAAYELLASDQHVGAVGVRCITAPQIEALLAELNQCRGSEVPHVPRSHFPFLISTMDDDGSGQISMREFFDLLDVVQYSYQRLRKASWAQRRLPRTYAALRLGRLKAWAEVPAGEGWGLERLLVGVMVVNAVSVVVESYQDYYDLEGQTRVCCAPNTWAWVDAAFALLYFANVGLTLVVIPFERYWLKLANRFDLFVTLGFAVITALWVAPAVHIPSTALRYFNLLRLMPLLKLLGHSEDMAFIADSFVRIAAGSVPILTLLFCTTAVWALVGCQAFGGYIHAGNAALLDSDLFDEDMDVLNFNDFASSLMIFLSMIVSGGPITEVIDAVGTGGCGHLVSALYFMSYVYFVSYVFFNCFVSFIIDAFIARYELQKDQALDAVLHAKLQSLYASMNDPEHDVIAQLRVKGSEELYKRMFADEIEEILEGFEADFEHEEIMGEVSRRASLAEAADDMVHGALHGAERSLQRQATVVLHGASRAVESGNAARESAAQAMRSAYGNVYGLTRSSMRGFSMQNARDRGASTPSPSHGDSAPSLIDSRRESQDGVGVAAPSAADLVLRRGASTPATSSARRPAANAWRIADV